MRDSEYNNGAHAMIHGRITRLQMPECPRCQSNAQVTRLAFAVYPKHVIDVYVCCLETFEVRSDDPEDPRLFRRRSESYGGPEVS